MLRTPVGEDLLGSVEPGAQLAAGGTVAAFLSASASLFPGDANELADAFAVAETLDATGGAPPAGLDQGPVDIAVGSDRELGMRIVSRRDGTLLVRVAVPQPGTLAAVATAPSAAGGAKSRQRRSSAKARRVAAARSRARRAGTVRLRLALRGRDLRAVRRGTPMRVRVVLTLAPADGSAARRAASTATFRVKARVGRDARR